MVNPIRMRVLLPALTSAARMPTLRPGRPCRPRGWRLTQPAASLRMPAALMLATAVALPALRSSRSCRPRRPRLTLTPAALPAIAASILATATLMLAPTAPLRAHHAVNVAYDTQNLRTVQGRVIDVFWRNPHVVITIERTLENGAREVWEAESGSTNSLDRLGIGRDIVQVGDRVALTGALSRRGLTTMAAYTMTLADGVEVPLWPQRAEELGRDVAPVPISAAAREQGEREARGIFRIWSRRAVPRFQSTLPFTEAAIAARAGFDPLTDDPNLNCIPPGMPAMMNNPYPIEFVDRGDRILLRLEEWDGERTIHLSADASTDAAAGRPSADADDQPPSPVGGQPRLASDRSGAGDAASRPSAPPRGQPSSSTANQPPPATVGQPPSPTGYSVGLWEGDTLVVTTTGIGERYFDDIGTPQSEDVHVVETFALNETRDRLAYRAVITDSATFVEPATISGAWYWNPGEEIKPFECALPGEEP